MKVIEYTKGVADLNENIQKSKPKKQMNNCVNEDDEQGHNANNDGNHHLVISGNGHWQCNCTRSYHQDFKLNIPTFLSLKNLMFSMDSGYQARFLPLASLHVAIECFYLEHNVLQYRNSLFHTYFRFDNIFLTWNRSLTQRLSLAEVSRKTALICFASLSPSSSVTALSLWRVRICHQHLGLSNPNWGPFSSWHIYLVRFNR